MLRSVVKFSRPLSLYTRPFHSSTACWLSVRDMLQETLKPEHAEANKAKPYESTTGGSLGTATGRIADSEAGQTPGFTPNTPKQPYTPKSPPKPAGYVENPKPAGYVSHPKQSGGSKD